ncbi:MAG: NAD-dependent dihydropyrimidine dehydrogenase subunit PreA [Armatimonadetes bacterium]|nr:NAD-dependent dihydropyrimidine dehydrogenase subunit PreA [Armatimonadota bacterium]
MADLSIDFAGIKSPNPFWLASGPLTNSGAQVSRAFELGWGGAVWKTLGEPVVNVYSRYGGMDYRGAKITGLNNIELITDRPLEENLKEIREVKKRFPGHAVIASLMVETREQWREIIKQVEDAGCDGIELNFGCPHGMCERGMGSAVGQEPKVLSEITGWTKEFAAIPVLVKLTPNIGNIVEPGIAAVRGKADGISLINTIKSIVGVDLDRFTPYPYVGGRSTNGGYCGPAVKPIALHMVGSLAREKEITIPISGIGGVSDWRDAAEFILMGASSVQVCTAAMHYGFRIIEEMLEGLSDYMDSKGFRTIADFVGKGARNFVEWGDLNLNYRIAAEISKDLCIGCQLCYVACNDGGHQCIHLDGPGGRVPRVEQEDCIGCNLCSLVCPVPGCITMKEIDTGKPYMNWKEFQKSLARA